MLVMVVRVLPQPMKPSKTVYVSRECWEIRTRENLGSGAHNSLDHTKCVRIHIFQQSFRLVISQKS